MQKLDIYTPSNCQRWFGNISAFISAWHRVADIKTISMASYLYRFISVVIALPLLKRFRNGHFISICQVSGICSCSWPISIWHWMTDVMCKGIISYRYRFHVEHFICQVSFHHLMVDAVSTMRLYLIDIASMRGDISARHSVADIRAMSK